MTELSQSEELNTTILLNILRTLAGSKHLIHFNELSLKARYEGQTHEIVIAPRMHTFYGWYGDVTVTVLANDLQMLSFQYENHTVSAEAFLKEFDTLRRNHEKRTRDRWAFQSMVDYETTKASK